MKKILLISFMLLSALVTESWAQDRSVSGKVTDDSGSGVPGVNVILKGTTTGTTSDIDGNYKMNVPAEGGTLVYSFIGMATQEIEIGARSVIDVNMAADATELTEVVVTAVGIERQAKALGYAVENVDGGQVKQVSEPDPLRALQGKVPGVNISGSSGAPGSATRITIRGNSSLLGNNQPLFVVDGIPMNNNTNANPNSNALTGGGASGSRIQDLDPANIASITVLKGAAAAVLYGSRASNGVVVVTTKTGSALSSKKGLEITYNTAYTTETVSNLPDYQNTYGTGTNFNFSQVNGSWGAPFIGTKPYATTATIPHWYDGVIGFEDLWGTTVPYQAYPNNVKDFFDTGSIIENSVSISGGGESSTLSVVLSRTKQEGIVPNTEFNRTSFSMGGQSQLQNGVNVGANFRYTHSFQHSFQGGANNAVGNGSAFGRTLYLGRNWDLHGQPFQNPLTNGSQFFVGTGQADNPLWSVENAGIESETDNFGATFDIGYDITDWLNIQYKIGLNAYAQSSIDYFRPGSRGAGGSGQIRDDHTRFQEVESNLILTASKDINEDISFTGLIGHNVNQRTTESQGYQGTGYVDFFINDIDNTNAVIPNGGRYTQRRLYGIFGDFTFGYRDYLFLNLSGRNDWSSTLPTSNRSFFYPAASVSFLPTDAFNISSDVLSGLKLRASYGQVGADTDPYRILPVYLNNANGIFAAGATAMPFNGSAGATLSNIARDPGLKPERTTEVEFGTNIQLLKNRIGIDLSIYDKKTTDQIVNIAIPAETGFTAFTTNIGQVNNKGIELGVNLIPLQMNNGFTWEIFTSFTHNRNVIDNLGGQEEVILQNTFAGSVQGVHIVGQEYGLLRGSTAARDDEGNLLINPADGQLISALNPEIIGNPNPDFNLGLTNTFSWKGITLSAVIDWKQGGDLYSVTNLSMLGRGVTKDTEDREINKVIAGVYGDVNTAEPLRDEAGNKTVNTTMVEVNTLYFGNTFAINGQDEFNVWDGTVIRLREVNLTYSLPNSLLEKTPFGAASIGFSGRNLWYNAPNFPKASNFDPEVSTYGNSNFLGAEFTSQPSTKRYGVKLSVTF